ncbi:MAG: hypothetical protein IKE10_02045 [Bacilli bacterium]|nr:hypothetical protein [Bacilli bacterium]
MLEFICYFMPSFISLKIYNYLNKKEFKVKDYFIYYGIFTVLNNIIVLSIICFKNYNEILYFDRVGITYLFKYLIMMIVSSIITPFIVSIIESNVKFRLEVKKSEKPKKNK